MTLREARRFGRAFARRCFDTQDFVEWEMMWTLLRALSRPTRLEREAARYLGTLPWVSPEMVSWLARYEAKRKRKP
jgi:hypothetical protein